LLAEFNAIQERAINWEQINASRVNFFLVVAAAAGGGLIAIAEVPGIQAYYQLIAIGALSALLLLGLLTLRDLIALSCATVMLWRRAGRARRWFVDAAPEIASYVAFEPADDRPTFTPHWTLAFRGGEALLLALNTASSALLAGVVLHQALWRLPGVVATGSLAVGLATWFLQRLYIHKRMQQAERSDWARKQIQFPSTTSAGASPPMDKDAEK
jgi:hypothetical protein